jgi:predicted aldo/keto reductase-like oxidoreductase
MYMADAMTNINRRDFLKVASSAGLAGMLASTALGADANAPQADPNAKKEDARPKYQPVGTRKLGKTGLVVPILNLGGIVDFRDNQMLLRRALDWGVNYWDTAHGYVNGNSEIGIGKFFEKHPELRKDVIIVTKSGARDAAGAMEHLKTSLQRMQTTYIDIFYLHGLDKPEQLNDELKNFAKSAKEKGLIKFYGFSTHSNMAACLDAAAKLDWIDVIMTTYNFREMLRPEMNAAVDACHKAGIGLVAMKTQAKGPGEESEKKLIDHFMQRGFTEHQAKIKAVWQDERFATICSAMPNVAILVSNVAAALDKTKLTQADMQVLREYAAATCSGYCAGCAEICEQAAENMPVRDIMRFAMYHDSYGMREHAKSEFAGLSSDIRNRLVEVDYTRAQDMCPHGLQIGQIIRDTVTKLA